MEIATDHHHLSLHTSKVQQPAATINRAFTVIRSIIITSIIYYRASSIIIFFNFFSSSCLAHLVIFIAELNFLLFFLLNQAFFWCPMSRTVFPERLTSEDDHKEILLLPGLDVFICTADPNKEPIVEVMNTVLSSLCLDYPQDKLSVYLSDDASSPVTLYALREASVFARSWLPFCKKYGIKTICPEAYFRSLKHKQEEKTDYNYNSASSASTTEGFMAEENEIKIKYIAFKERLERATAATDQSSSSSSKNDHLPIIEVIHDDHDGNKMPRLVYVSREKRRDQPHHYKAGALNALLRVSGIISKAPYILVLDCDVYCNDPTSAKQAMCFHLDPQINSSLAFVQFPQMFYSISENDIYDGQLRTTFKSRWQGMDGVSGPGLSGTCFYLKRQAVLFPSPIQDIDLHEFKNCFGSSNMFIRTVLNENHSSTSSSDASAIYNEVLREAKILATCDYEKETKWGKQVGFLYQCKLESTFTGYYLHCQGWKSVYVYPSRPSFLGCPPLNMNDKFSQIIKWSSELLHLGFFSSLSPLKYGLSRLPIMQSMFYIFFTLAPVASISLLLYSTLPQLCFLLDIPLFPKVTNPWFGVFAMAIVACFAQHLFDTGGSLRILWNELRIWLIMSVTCNFFVLLDALKNAAMGINSTGLDLTNKVVCEEELKIYEKGEFNIRGTVNTLLPLIVILILGAVSFIVGVQRMICDRSYISMFGSQAFLSFFPLAVSYPVFKEILLRLRNTRA